MQLTDLRPEVHLSQKRLLCCNLPRVPGFALHFSIICDGVLGVFDLVHGLNECHDVLEAAKSTGSGSTLE